MLSVFKDIAKNAPFPGSTMKGTSKEVMGQTIGGDQDDWTSAALGIPSATAEVGYEGQFFDSWRVKDASTANEILSEQSAWIQYIYNHLYQFGDMMQNFE